MGKDVVFVLGDWEHDGPLHVELWAKEVPTVQAGLQRVVEALANADGVEAAVCSDEHGLVLQMTIQGVQVHVVLKADAERIEAEAKVQEYNA